MSTIRVRVPQFTKWFEGNPRLMLWWYTIVYYQHTDIVKNDPNPTVDTYTILMTEYLERTINEVLDSGDLSSSPLYKDILDYRENIVPMTELYIKEIFNHMELLRANRVKPYEPRTFQSSVGAAYDGEYIRLEQL
tara:strand:- start:175972 stop:176376 length:405 start_codon:yes stop_codon:yes gene_type:complete